MSELKIGDKVNFVVGTSLLTGVITKFYKSKSTYNSEECSVKTKWKTYPHILLRRVEKIKENEDIHSLKQQLAEKDKEIEKLKVSLFNKIFIEKTKLDEYWEKQLRHEICEKIRNKAFATEAYYLDKKEIVQYTISKQDLDKIERGDE